MTINWVLAESSRMRYAAGSSMYFAQGIPYGLMNIAVPAWLASQGVGAGQIATFLAVIILPWAFKLLSGPLMDRYQFLAMGRRRPWVLGAQLGMTLSFFGLVLVDNPVEQVGLLTVLGLLINVFAATQDVAVDGLAIEVTPVDEQGRLNGFMVFGKAIGWAVTSAVSGMMLVTFGMGVTALVAAVVQAVFLLGFMMTVEHRGERRLPWSTGAAMSERRAAASFADVFKGLNAVLWSRVSLILMAIMLFDGFISGYGHALMPIAAINLFGFTTPEWSQLVAVMGLAGAAVALALGPMIDRFGAKRMLILTVSLVAIHAILLAQTQFLWENTTYVRVMLAAWVLLGPVTMVCMIALAMAICSSANSATQFAIYMSVANLGASAGSKSYGMIAEQTSYVEAYLLLGAITVTMIFITLFHRHRPAEQTGRKRAPSYTVGMGAGGSGMYFSGAMRCPKCRADMEQVMIDNTEVDRCFSCHGLWFDAGELSKLRTKEAAAALDIGDIKTGKTQNRVDNYRCPRCAGPMHRMVDPEQPHIWFEQCGSCRGSFFDAGELTDLVTVSVGDFFKRFVTPERR
ncbi:MFS transporter [Thioalkalivibrio sp. XN8]|uniref:MFS transporter n=1 Tax=Thioalkalivibrio sp. XN8 TaxID=2712863 RepID=UPI0013EB17A6|nr:MFS transporter [Thioalkalivibrio sp. XN8]NGP51983.1 MFS transporter [Thioalkalivibrio sp. XN8]